MRTTLFILLFLLSFSAKAQELLITPTPIATNIESPVAIDHAGDGSGRLFIVQRAGRVLIWENGEILAEPFLDISERVSCCGERGLLGIAFHPEFASNGRFIVNYTNSEFATSVSAFLVTGDENVADAGSEEVILTVEQPFSNHNGGHLAFGPDGYLYIGLGDGGSGGDPMNVAQNRQSLLGKMLRIDVDSDSPYSIPADNPFAADDFTLDEIWALGLRNPFRYSFDRISGDLYIADVGQDAIEEVHVHRVNTASGENYGWRLMEGSQCFNPGSGCNDGSLTLPAFEYSHGSGRCSITGGFVYRGSNIPALQGAYLFGDFCSGEIFAAREVAGSWQQEVLLDTSFQISSFGENEQGEIFVADINGSVYELQAALIFSPGSGSYLRSQTVDLAMAVRADLALQSLSMQINGIDISEAFTQCSLTGSLADGGQSWRCPGIDLSVLAAGHYRIQVDAILANSRQLETTVYWDILDNTEP